MSENQVLLPLFDLDEQGNSVRVVDFFVDKKTMTIYFMKSIENKKIKFSTKIKAPNIKAAKRFANAELTRRIGKKKIKLSSLVRDEIPNWIKIKEAEGLDESTLRVVYNAAKRIEAFWGDFHCHEINQDNFAAFVAWHTERFPGQGMDNVIKYLRNFAKYLAQKVVNDRALLPAVPKMTDPNLKHVKARRKRKALKIFTADEFKKIHAAASTLEEEVLCLFMYTMATRIDETLKLRFDEEVFLDTSPPMYQWSIGTNKADLWGHHALHPALIEPLTALKAIRDSQGTSRLFPQGRDTEKALKPQQVDWNGWYKRAGLGWKWSSKTFRHTCLSNLFNDERNPQALICLLYRISLKVAMETYIKPTEEGRNKMRTALTVDL